MLHFPCNTVLDFLTLPFKSEVSLNKLSVKKSYNTTVFNPSTRLSLHANTPLTSVELGWSSFFSIPGNWGVEVVGWGAWDCVWVLRMSWQNLKHYSFLIKLSLVLFSHRTRKKYISRNNIYSRNFKNSSIKFDRLMAVVWFLRTSQH